MIVLRIDLGPNLTSYGILDFVGRHLRAHKTAANSMSENGERPRDPPGILMPWSCSTPTAATVR